jgi:hypothetical protein
VIGSIDLAALLKGIREKLTGADRRRYAEEAALILVEEARNEIVRLAMARLNTTADDYIAGLQVERITTKGGWFSPDTITHQVILVGMLPNMIEKGWPGGDMKPALLAGRNAKVGKDGKRYNTVPFRHMGTNATGRNGQPFGSQYREMLGQDWASRLGKSIEKMAKRLRPGQRLEAGHAPRLRAHHKTDLYAGLHKRGQPRHTQYMTFRRVSENSDPRAWLHPGIQPANLFPEVEAHIDRVSGAILRGMKR